MAVDSASPYTGPLIWYCLVSGGVFFMLGLIVAFVVDLPAQRAAHRATAAVSDATDAGGSAQRGSIGDAAESVATLVGALRELTLAMRLAMIGVFLTGIAAIAAGADAIGASR